MRTRTYTPQQAAPLLGVPTQKVAEMVQDGQLHVTCDGGVAGEEIAAVLRAREVATIDADGFVD